VVTKKGSNTIFSISMEDLEENVLEVIGRRLTGDEIQRLKCIMDADWIAYKHLMQATIAYMLPEESLHAPQAELDVAIEYVTSDIPDMEET
jgi:hypothetical protein